MAKGWKCLRVKKVFANRWMRLENHTVRSPKGHTFDHAVICAGPSVRVIGVTGDGRIVITREFRYPAGVWNYELPGGGSEGLTPAAAARKELKEETGYTARRLQRVGKFVVYSGLSSEFCHAFIATGLRQQGQQLERTETITTRTVSWAELEAMIASNRFRDGLSLAALMMARKEITSTTKTQRTQRSQSRSS